MKYIHKVGFIKRFGNNSMKTTIIEFKSDCNDYKSACLSIVNHNKEYQDCFLFEPVTKSPITFDLTVKLKGHNDNHYNCDRYFHTFKELIAYCDTLENNKDFLSVVTQPFCRTLFSESGKLGECHNRWFKLDIRDQGEPLSPFFGGDYKSFDIEVFNQIKTGSYKHDA